MSDTTLADLIDRVVKVIGSCLTWRKISKLRTWPPCAAGSPAAAAQLKEMEHLHNQEMDAVVEFRQAGALLAPELERIGEDSSGLLRLLHFIDGGGGPDNAYPVWPDVKVALQQLAIRLRVGRPLRLSAGGNGEAARDGAAVRKPRSARHRGADKKQEARDKWIYQQCCKGKELPYGKIRAELKKIAGGKGWEPINSIQGIRLAAARYADAHSLAPIPNRQNL